MQSTHPQAKMMVLIRPHTVASCVHFARRCTLISQSAMLYHTRVRLDQQPRVCFQTRLIAPVTPRRRLSFRVTSQVNDSGSIDSPLMQSMEKKIKEQLNAESVNVKDAYGDGRHVSIDVVASAFEGKSAVNRQRMVYKSIWEELQSTVHAVDQMTTRTPNEAASKLGYEKIRAIALADPNALTISIPPIYYFVPVIKNPKDPQLHLQPLCAILQ